MNAGAKNDPMLIILLSFFRCLVEKGDDDEVVPLGLFGSGPVGFIFEVCTIDLTPFALYRQSGQVFVVPSS